MPLSQLALYIKLQLLLLSRIRCVGGGSRTEGVKVRSVSGGTTELGSRLEILIPVILFCHFVLIINQHKSFILLPITVQGPNDWRNLITLMEHQTFLSSLSPQTTDRQVGSSVVCWIKNMLPTQQMKSGLTSRRGDPFLQNPSPWHYYDISMTL